MSDQGWTPLMSAVSAGREEAVNLLLENGADVNAKNSSGQRALHYAVHLPPTSLQSFHCPAQHATPNKALLIRDVLAMSGLLSI